MFGNRRDRHQSDEHAARATPPTAPGGSSTARRSHDLDEAAPLYTLPMPYDVAADHESVIVYALRDELLRLRWCAPIKPPLIEEGRDG